MASCYNALENFSFAIQRYEKALGINPFYTAAHLGLAEDYLHLDKLDKAEYHTQKAQELDDTSPEPLINLGLIAIKKEQFDRAIDYFNKALEINDDPFVYFELSSIYLTKGDRKKAIKNLQKTIEIDNNYLDAYYSLAQIYEESGEIDKSIEYYSVCEQMARIFLMCM
jgi:Tfp pilus assembly protein PilF